MHHSSAEIDSKMASSAEHEGIHYLNCASAVASGFTVTLGVLIAIADKVPEKIDFQRPENTESEGYRWAMFYTFLVVILLSSVIQEILMHLQGIDAWMKWGWFGGTLVGGIAMIAQRWFDRPKARKYLLGLALVIIVLDASMALINNAVSKAHNDTMFEAAGSHAERYTDRAINHSNAKSDRAIEEVRSHAKRYTDRATNHLSEMFKGVIYKLRVEFGLESSFALVHATPTAWQWMLTIISMMIAGRY
eukprot:gnl/TRDRNA2_/TRDRNA2_93538_c0_seq1.p1 gnl/TRDRNA2_/TRDRNA2_93538_c0~~gnl/TRDRNA2_/TRDRNA2_93538_c0_seq1.p1  ORF type:complete len:248 (-),score=10.84 gnl/TRDRNA2_/TRDRNA2_93538_c0_seq1:174-917(-)